MIPLSTLAPMAPVALMAPIAPANGGQSVRRCSLTLGGGRCHSADGLDLQHRVNLPQRSHNASRSVPPPFLRWRLRLVWLVEERKPDEPKGRGARRVLPNLRLLAV